MSCFGAAAMGTVRGSTCIISAVYSSTGMATGILGTGSGVGSAVHVLFMHSRCFVHGTVGFFVPPFFSMFRAMSFCLTSMGSTLCGGLGSACGGASTSSALCRSCSCYTGKQQDR